MRSRVAQFGKSNRCFADRQCHRDDINSLLPSEPAQRVTHDLCDPCEPLLVCR
jgi:hypothetical protein